MIAEEISQGVKNIFCTPHYRIPYTKEKEETKRIFNEFNEKVKEKNLPVNLYLGQEIAVNENTLSMLKSGRLLTLDDGKYVLLEFCLTKKTTDVSETVHEFVVEGFKPIVAHIERYPYLRRRVRRKTRRRTYSDKRGRRLRGRQNLRRSVHKKTDRRKPRRFRRERLSLFQKKQYERSVSRRG